MSKKLLSILALLLMAVTGAQADTEANGGTTTISSDRTDDYIYLYNGTLVINQDVTFTCNNAYFKIGGDFSTVELHGTLTGNVSSSNWTSGVINVYLSDGAKYTVTGQNPPNESDLRYYGYDADTDGNGTVAVKNGSTDVTSTSVGYKTTTYTFTANPSSGYKFKNWTKGAGGEVLGTDASINVTCEQNGTYQVYANFEEDGPSAVNLTANSDGETTPSYWATYYNSMTSFTADANTTVYKGAVSGGNLQLTAVADIPKGNAVVLKSSSATITLTPAATTTADFTGNELKGGTTVASGNDAYTLSRGSAGTGTLGFYKFNGASLDGSKAHLELPTGWTPSPARNFIGFGDDNTTAIEAPAAKSDVEDGKIYDLTGRRIEGQPTKKGIYVKNGQKIIVK